MPENLPILDRLTLWLNGTDHPCHARVDHDAQRGRRKRIVVWTSPGSDLHNVKIPQYLVDALSSESDSWVVKQTCSKQSLNHMREKGLAYILLNGFVTGKCPL
jgi:hypothetical protein